MSFAVLPALIPDISPVYDVYFEAFKNEKILEYLFPGGVDRQAHKHGITLWWHQDSNGYTIKCVDADTGTIVGMAQWEVFWRPGKQNLWKMPKGAEWLKGDKRKKAESVLIPNWSMREKLFGGRKHVYCVTMAVHPNYQHKGIGRSLVQWGIDVAEQLHLPIYLESTDKAVPLYESAGFQRVTHETLVRKASLTGQKEDVVVPIFVRMPNKANGLTFQDWAGKGYPESY